MWLIADNLIPEPVSCNTCQREIPRADALTIEGQEYLYFFCGSGCYTQWSWRQFGQEGRSEPFAPHR